MQLAERYNSISTVLQKKYGTKVYKLALESGTTCPNRDGTLSDCGCSFCSAGGSGDFASKGADFSADGINKAISDAISRVSAKLKNVEKPLFIPYFQSYSATYAPAHVLRERFFAAINHPLAAELAVATRPDTISDEVLELLKELSKIKPVTVEMGLQTADDTVAEFHNRKCPTEKYKEAVERLKDAGIGTVLHMIAGLPCPPEYGCDYDGHPRRLESRGSILETASYIASLKPDGIKIHMLHVMEGTRLGESFKKGAFRELQLQEYADILCDVIESLPGGIAVHRITGDAPKKLLLAPMWSGDKKKVLAAVSKRMAERNTYQGKNRG